MGNRIQKARMAYQDVASRITGFSIPIFGIQWNPPEPERETVRKLIYFLEDRRALYVPYCLEIPEQVERSVLEIRSELTAALQSLPTNSNAIPPIRAMRAACRKYLTEPSPDFPHFDRGMGRHRYDRHDGSPGFFVALGELRATFGTSIATLSAEYGVDLEEELASILPAPPDEE